MVTQLQQCWEGDGPEGGWYRLAGGGNWASIEGSAVEWWQVAKGLRSHKDVRFTRCCLTWTVDIRFAQFHSPRNACSENDTVLVYGDEASTLAEQIEKLLMDCGEPCVRGDFDPIALGA